MSTRRSPFATACCFGNLPEVLRFINQKYNVYNDPSALVFAAKCGYNDIVKLLIDHKANIHAFSYKAFLGAVKYCSIDVVRYFLDHGADIHAHRDSAIIIAIQRRNADLARMLLDYGANVNAQFGRPMVFAYIDGFLDTIELLLDREAIVNMIILRMKTKMTSKIILYPNDGDNLPYLWNSLPINERIILFYHNQIQVYPESELRHFKILISAIKYCGLSRPRNPLCGLQELCKKAILVYSRVLPKSIAFIDLAKAVDTIRTVAQ
jgi:ankyrin repeat protein